METTLEQNDIKNIKNELRQLKDLFEKLAYLQHVTFSEGKQSEKEFMIEFQDVMDKNIHLLY